jgi:hypothetical protein
MILNSVDYILDLVCFRGFKDCFIFFRVVPFSVLITFKPSSLKLSDILCAVKSAFSSVFNVCFSNLISIFYIMYIVQDYDWVFTQLVICKD